MNSKSLYLIVLFLLPVVLSSQTFEEFKKQEDQNFQSYLLQQQKFIEDMQQEFTDFVKQQDEEFLNYLNQEWKQFRIFQEIGLPENPKPPVIKEYDNTITQINTEYQVRIVNDDLSTYSIDTQRTRPVVHKPPFASEDLIKIDLPFYGSSLKFEYDPNDIIKPTSEISENNISNYWADFSGTNFTGLINQLQNYKSIMNLNDWAYFKLVKDLSDKLNSGNKTGSELFSWCMLLRSGYDVKIGFTERDLTLLYPCRGTIYSKKYMVINGLNYYLDKDIEFSTIETYEKQYPQSYRILDLNIRYPLNFSVDKQTRTFKLNHGNNIYDLNIDYNKNIVDFYLEYPQTDIEVYFNASITPLTKVSLLSELTKYTSKLSVQEAAGLILKFVQSSFKYELDKDQFGKEKFLFAEETIFYRASDCEDRSVLFAYLIRELLNLEVIGLKYPGHIATAILIPDAVQGDIVVFNDKRYTIADPTFTNAPLGMTMPQFREMTPDIIAVNNKNYINTIKDKFWTLAANSGGYHGDILVDVAIDNEGNGYLTGYYVDGAEFDHISLGDSDKTSQKRSAFVVSYSKDGKIRWVDQLSGNKDVTGYSLTINPHGNIIVVGSFSGKLYNESNIPEFICNDSKTDVFIASYSSDGKQNWISKAGLDSYFQDNFFTYFVSINNEGQVTGTTVYNEDQYSPDYNPYFDDKGIFNIYGSFKNSTGFGTSIAELELADEGTFNINESLKIENDKLIEDNCERTIAGVLAVINHIKLTGFSLQGADAQKTLDIYNPDFKQEYPDVYEGISAMNLIMNDDGIITVKTQDEKTVILRELKISNNSTMKVTQFEDGNSQLDFLNGVFVGKLFIWFKLNYAKMFRENGDILFDYDKDHTQKLMNLKEDILD